MFTCCRNGIMTIFPFSLTAIVIPAPDYSTGMQRQALVLWALTEKCCDQYWVVRCGKYNICWERELIALVFKFIFETSMLVSTSCLHSHSEVLLRGLEQAHLKTLLMSAACVLPESLGWHFLFRCALLNLTVGFPVH